MRIIAFVVLKELPVIRERGVCCALPEVDARWAEDSANLMKALADPVRLTMVAALWKAKAPVCICDFTADFDLTQPTISHHMAKLREVGLVESSKEGIWTFYRLRRDIAPRTKGLLRELIA